MLALHLEELKQDVESIFVVIDIAGVGSSPGGKCSRFIF
jgi:hypothetical protein